MDGLKAASSAASAQRHRGPLRRSLFLPALLAAAIAGLAALMQPQWLHPGWVALAAGLLPMLLLAWLQQRQDGQSRAALRQSEAEFRASFELAAVGKAQLDPQGLRFLRVNAALARMLGHDEPGSLLGQALPALIAAEDRGAADAAIARLLHGQVEAIRPELRLLRRDGAPFWVRASVTLAREAATGAPRRLLCVIEDIDAQRRAEARMRDSEARLRSLVDTAVDAIIVADAAGLIVSANPAAARMFRLADPQAMQGMALGALMPEAMASRHAGFLASHAATGGAGTMRAIGVPGRELLARRADGEAFPAEISVGSFIADGARFFTGVLRDASDRRAAEERQALLTREVDHRAKNALAVVLSLLRLTPRNLPPADFAEAVEGRITALARAHSLLASQRWAGTDLRLLAEGEMAAFGGRCDIGGPAVQLAPRAAQPVAMLLHELATNAAKHGALSAPGGRVAIDWAFDPTGNLLLQWREKGGPPVPPPPEPGFGMRLLHSVVERQLAGTLQLDWPAEGLHASVLLPAEMAMPATSAGTVATMDAPTAFTGMPPLPPPRSPPRVLVVEDEALVAMELEAVLTALGCEVVGPARSLAEAVCYARGEERLDAAVLDVNLGGSDRVFPAADILATRGVPVLFATGYGSAASLEGRDARAVAVLRKPFPREALASALGAALRRG